jgi:hypothetical protein
MLGLSLAQEVSPCCIFPGLAEAVILVLWPTSNVWLRGETVISHCGGDVTVIVDIALVLWFKHCPVIVACPAATALTFPLPSTVATPGLLLDQEVPPCCIFPGRAVAARLALWPTSNVWLCGEMLISHCGGNVTVIEDVALVLW